MPSTICKGAILSDFEAIQLDDSQVLIIPHFDAAQESFRDLLLE